MAPSNIGYSIREAGHHFVRNGSTTFGAVVTIFLSLFIIGLFAMGSVLLDGMVGTVEDQVTIQAFVSDSASEDDINALQTKIEGWDEVESVTFKTKDEALAEYRDTMTNKNAPNAVQALDGKNPIPASLVIKLHDPQDVEGVAQRLGSDADFAKVADITTNDDGSQTSPADEIQYGQGTVERLFTVTNWIRVITLVLVALLTFVAFVFINNTIRLSISSRRREIAIQRLVGASNGFIRGPFIMEGVLQAVIGSAFAIAALEAIRRFGLPELATRMTFLNFSIPLKATLSTYGLLVGMGLIIGLFGSAIAMRRYLKV
ncbi:permease-like cell division protein FtsX [uncultured Parolsenella sp.]|uniref:permease-like cell division protein FtsX n=1 Tax=uncultured Parolsenella sp. TaxID=2083008 RepID=UPI0027DD3440|nr:permease-like cell division protein FtsX [uncultured Parolsenella sp.]